MTTAPITHCITVGVFGGGGVTCFSYIPSRDPFLPHVRQPPALSSPNLQPSFHGPGPIMLP